MILMLLFGAGLLVGFALGVFAAYPHKKKKVVRKWYDPTYGVPHGDKE